MTVQELIDALVEIDNRELSVEIEIAENTYMPIEDIGFDESIVVLMP